MRIFLQLLTVLFLFTTGSSAIPSRDKWEGLAKKGEVKAMISLGLLYHTGDGVKVDYVKAMDWYLMAYAKNDGDALNNIGVLYKDGLGVTKNENIAYLLFLKVHMEGLGTEATQIRAGRNLGRLVKSMKKEEIYKSLSYTWDYADQVIKSRGKNMAIGKEVLPTNTKARPRIRDNQWWLDSERKKMDFKSPAPWDKILDEKVDLEIEKLLKEEVITLKTIWTKWMGKPKLTYTKLTEKQWKEHCGNWRGSYTSKDEDEKVELNLSFEANGKWSSEDFRPDMKDGHWYVSEGILLLNEEKISKKSNVATALIMKENKIYLILADAKTGLVELKKVKAKANEKP